MERDFNQLLNRVSLLALRVQELPSFDMLIEYLETITETNRTLE